MTASRSLTACSTVLAVALTGCVFGVPATPLGSAAARGDLAAMTKLLDAGADPNGAGAFAITPLAVAARSGRVEAIELLLKRGADPHLGSGVNGWTPLLHALHKDQLAAAERLARTCEAPSAELDRALYMAAGYAQTASVEALLARGADPRRSYETGANALAHATAGAFDIDTSYRGCAAHTATVRALLAASPGLTLEGEAGREARRAAERRGCADLLALLDGR
jgi:ankyrin repeat protein